MKKLFTLLALMAVMCVTAMAGTWSTSKDYYFDPSACTWFYDSNPNVYITYDSAKILAEKQKDGTYKFRLTSVPSSTINFQRTDPGNANCYWNSIKNVAAPDNDTYNMFKGNSGYNGGSWEVYTAPEIGTWSTDKDYYVNTSACTWFTNGGAVLRINDGKSVVNTEVVSAGIYKFRLTNPGDADGYITLLRQDPSNSSTTWNSASIAAPTDASYNMMSCGAQFDAATGYTWGVYDSGAPKYPETLYVIGNLSGAGWNPSNGLAMTASEDGVYSANDVTLESDNNGANAYFSFTSKLSSSSSDWDSIASSRYGATSNDFAASLTDANTLLYGTNAFVVPNGKYDITVSLVDMTMTIKSVGEVVVTYPETLYIIGTVNGSDFAANNGIEMTEGAETGMFSIDKVSIGGELGTEYGYFSFADVLGRTASDYSAMTYRYGASEGDFVPILGGPNTIQRGEYSFKIESGDYKINIDLKAGEMTISIVEPVVEPGEPISLNDLCYVSPADEEEIKDESYWKGQVMIGMQLIGNWSINTTPATATLSKDGTVILSLENTNSEQCYMIDYGTMADADLTGSKTLALIFDTENGISENGLYTMTIPEGFLINNGHPNAEYTYSWQIGEPTPAEITLPETLYMLIGVGTEWNKANPVTMTKQEDTATIDGVEYNDYYANVELKAGDLFNFAEKYGEDWDTTVNTGNRWGAAADTDVAISTTQDNRTKNALKLYQVNVDASGCKSYKVPTGTEAGKYLVHVYLNKDNATPYVTLFKDGSTVSVAGIEADGEAAYYTLEGLKVAEPTNGLYIKVVNGKATKVLIRK